LGVPQGRSHNLRKEKNALGVDKEGGIDRGWRVWERSEIRGGLGVENFRNQRGVGIKREFHEPVPCRERKERKKDESGKECIVG